MKVKPREELERRLNLARNGGGILFCGAGYSADSLSFAPDEKLGTGAQLLDIFNQELHQDPPYGSLQNAADALQEKIGESGLMDLLKDKFTVSNVTTDMTRLLRYPWQAIYTTNYDDALETGAKHEKVRIESFNNDDEIPHEGIRNIPIIHLHGYVQKWNRDNFRSSCVLGAESYLKLTHARKWLSRFRRDVDQAQLVVFVGFNAGDFHLNRAINDLTGLKAKAFFINRPTAESDPDVIADQKRLGSPLCIGRGELVKSIERLLAQDAPKEPRLASFEKYLPPNPAVTVPSQKQIEDLFLFGRAELSQLARDISNDVSDYHIQRSVVQEALDAIENGARIVHFNGAACDGKTLITEDLAYRLSGVRPVYRQVQSYENLLDEIAKILNFAPNAALIMENCFDLSPEWLMSIARQFERQEGVLILTSRSVAFDASPGSFNSLYDLDSFRDFSVGSLSGSEMRNLRDLADQVAGWRDFRELSQDDKIRFIRNKCQASLPNFLLELFKSEYVAQRYREEFNKLALDEGERKAVIAALYVINIGKNVSLNFLSNVMNEDYGEVIRTINARAAGKGGFCLIRQVGGSIETVPSIGARNILQNLFKDIEIVETVVFMLRNLAEMVRYSSQHRMFEQLMRFSFLSNVGVDNDVINDFFENSKQVPQIRERPLFWLQWHMAKCAAKQFGDAKKFLDQGRTAAEGLERRTGRPYDYRQFDDRHAKLLMMRVEEDPRTAASELLKVFREAIQLTGKILHQNDPQHYPFETLGEIVRVYGLVRDSLGGGQPVLDGDLKKLVEYARRRIGVLVSPYQRERAQRVLDGINF
ncbi:SIR2 family protein [Bombella apis]|uniref:SIR2 family protein n=1 Tax=Bombella apis TaxID=1785988 RepID=UPI002013081F|nr:SIR2 family protein [Bombella apis]MCL1562517.1 hypothetical protein [Parasaccharibacter sp. TMW 2.1886]